MQGDDQMSAIRMESTVPVVYSDLVTKSEDLVGWLTFDELNGTQVNDQSGSGPTAIWWAIHCCILFLLYWK